MNAYIPDMVVSGGKVLSGAAVIVHEGRVSAIGNPSASVVATRLPSQAILPGMVNAHSHAFQRTLRGRTHWRGSTGATRDDFWSWRHQMYEVASRLTPESIFAASRMAFLEMALSGITSVGEFHYIHRDTRGLKYGDPNEMARQIIRAAREVGLRIALLRVVYARAGYNAPEDPRQKRFFDSDPGEALGATRILAASTREDRAVTVGLAPHSVRAVPLDWLTTLAPEAKKNGWVVHMHVGEQAAEVEACLAEYKKRPVELIAPLLLNDKFTAVHAIQSSPEEMELIAKAGANVCACPTTERDLGDGTFPADQFLTRKVSVALGSDSHATIDLFEEARELELNLRLAQRARNVLAQRCDGGEGVASIASLAQALWQCATSAGARSLGVEGGDIVVGAPADFFSVDLAHPSIAGATAEDLLPTVVFGAARNVVRGVWVGGEAIVKNGQHAKQAEIIAAFSKTQKSLWP
jgi:formimidoylglutamate deiminase